MQAQLNEIGEKTVELIQKDREVERYIHFTEATMQEFQLTIADVKAQLAKVKIDEVGFNANVTRIDRYFEEAKRDAKRLYDLMGERERNFELAKAQLISAFEKSQKEQDAKLKRLLVIESSIQSLRTDVDFLKQAKSKDESKVKQ